MNELPALIHFDSDYQQTSLICYTETWLSEDITDTHLDGFNIIPLYCGFTENNKWAANDTVREIECCRHCLYLPCEFTAGILALSMGLITI